jgi:hypothetical protein
MHPFWVLVWAEVRRSGDELIEAIVVGGRRPFLRWM